MRVIDSIQEDVKAYKLTEDNNCLGKRQRTMKESCVNPIIA